MKIRKVSVISLIAVLFSISVFAQKSSVETASLSMKTYKKESERKETRIHSLKEAKKHVDLAVKNETTANDPKMWLMRATTYMAIYSDKLGEEGKKIVFSLARDYYCGCCQEEESSQNNQERSYIPEYSAESLPMSSHFNNWFSVKLCG